MAELLKYTWDVVHPGLQSQVNANVSARRCDELAHTHNQIWLEIVYVENTGSKNSTNCVLFLPSPRFRLVKP